jgi:hypothetical protein
MATPGDGTASAAVGWDTCAGSVQANTIDTEITKARDYAAGWLINLPKKITVSATAPSSPAVNDVWIKTS